MFLFNKHAGDVWKRLSGEKEFMKRTAPREASEIIANNMSRTAQTACFKGQQGAFPGKLTGKCRFLTGLFIIEGDINEQGHVIDHHAPAHHHISRIYFKSHSDASFFFSLY